MTGYLLLIRGKQPAYRIIFKRDLQTALKDIPKLKKEVECTIDVLRIVDGDTKITNEEVYDNVYSEE